MSDWGKGAENNDIGWGQGVINNSIGWGSIYSTSESGDTVLVPAANVYENATTAYSLEDLGFGASYVVRVRRSSDDTEQNFTASEITDGTLTSFCGVGDGFVVHVNEQINETNLLRQTAEANQGKIVKSGSLYLMNGKPAIEFTSIQTYQFDTNLTFDNLFYVASLADSAFVFQDDNGTSRIRLRDNTTPKSLQWNIPGVDANSQFWGFPGGIPLNQQHLVNANVTDLTGYINNVSSSQTLTTLPAFSIKNFGVIGIGGTNGSFQELITYTTALADPTPIRTDIISRYSIPSI